MARHTFNTKILKFKDMGEKTGWTYIEMSAEYCNQLKPGFRRAFRVKGTLNSKSVKEIAILPMGGGNFIMPLNAAIRKLIGKREGDILQVSLEEDTTPQRINADLMSCLEDEPKAMKQFKTLTASHQRYFSKWIESAKSEETISKRILLTIHAMLNEQNFAQMLRANKKS